MPNKGLYSLSSDRGSVLVLALWAVAALALGATAIIATGRVQQTIARNEAEALRQELALQSGIHVAMHGLLNRPADWPVDGRPRMLEIGAERIRVSIADEAGKIDVNTASEDFLLGLLGPINMGHEQKRRVVAAIQDWRDLDDDRRALGSERVDYADSGYNYEPRNRPFANPVELRRVKGMDAAIYSQVASAMTVYSQKSGVDVLVATSDVLKRLPGMDPAAANSAVQSRRSDADAGGPMTHIGRTVMVRAAMANGRAVAEWSAVIRLVGNRADQLRVMAWHKDDVLIENRH